MEAATVKRQLDVPQSPVASSATAEPAEHDDALHLQEQTRLSILGYNPGKHDVDSAGLLDRLCASFHVLISHEAGELEKLLGNDFWVDNEDERNIIVAIRKSTFERMTDREVTDHEVVHRKEDEVHGLKLSPSQSRLHCAIAGEVTRIVPVHLKSELLECMFIVCLRTRVLTVKD